MLYLQTKHEVIANTALFFSLYALTLHNLVEGSYIQQFGKIFVLCLFPFQRNLIEINLIIRTGSIFVALMADLIWFSDDKSILGYCLLISLALAYN
jgi:hypothetical protein